MAVEPEHHYKKTQTQCFQKRLIRLIVPNAQVLRTTFLV